MWEDFCATFWIFSTASLERFLMAAVDSMFSSLVSSSVVSRARARRLLSSGLTCGSMIIWRSSSSISSFFLFSISSFFLFSLSRLASAVNIPSCDGFLGDLPLPSFLFLKGAAVPDIAGVSGVSTSIV